MFETRPDIVLLVWQRFRVQIWDKDLLNPNDILCEAILNLQKYIRVVSVPLTDVVADHPLVLFVCTELDPSRKRSRVARALNTPISS